jgi:diguanylate cyclase (GGDEF)-like protein/PAS domain S-box-containing protein
MKKLPAKAAAPERRVKSRRRDEVAPDFGDLVENAVDGILVHRNFRPLYANQAMARLFGYNAVDQLLALPLLRPLIPSDSWARMEQDYDDLVHDRRPSFITRLRALHKDGHEIWLAVTQRVVKWQGEKAVCLTAIDISTQMEVEQNLLETEQHLRSILEILPQPIYIARRSDGQLLYVNRKTCLLFQQRTNQLLKCKSTDFFVDPKERDDLLQLFETLHDIRDVEVKMKTTSGREFTAEMAAIAVDYAGQAGILVALNDVSQRKQLEAELLQQANTDGLTGTSNRRHFLNQAEQEIRRSRRFARPMSVLMMDVDHFKKINDNHGHAVGDAVLQSVVKRALESLRQSDFLGRIGGEEFAVILPETDLNAATEAAERLRVHIAERALVAERAAIPVTTSIGVAQLAATDGTIDDVLHRADTALYRAKHNGRNRVEVSA